MNSISIEKIVEKILKDCLDIKYRESILVVTDVEKDDTGEIIFKQGIQMGLEAIIIKMIPTGVHGGEPPAVVSEAMKNCADKILIDFYENLKIDSNRKNLDEILAELTKINLNHLGKIRIFDILWWSYLKAESLKNEKGIKWTSII